mmetsp:Transcript_137880/g.326673  ORF Transcript_137880/g.326673 Transcript_137880/m.326673 type:complete len:216 (+) Transcript_137880:1325-1972(+)
MDPPSGGRAHPEDLACLVQVLPRELRVADDHLDRCHHDPGEVARLPHEAREARQSCHQHPEAGAGLPGAESAAPAPGRGGDSAPSQGHDCPQARARDARSRSEVAVAGPRRPGSAPRGHPPGGVPPPGFDHPVCHTDPPGVQTHAGSARRKGRPEGPRGVRGPHPAPLPRHARSGGRATEAGPVQPPAGAVQGCHQAAVYGTARCGHQESRQSPS